jgi:ribonuclease P protein component
MFSKNERLNRSEFNHFFAVGKRIYSPYFTIITAPAPTQKVAVVVGKKVAKSAVRRNMLRRRVYAQLREQSQSLGQGVFIMLVKPAFARLTRLEAKKICTEAIAQVSKSA